MKCNLIKINVMIYLLFFISLFLYGCSANTSDIADDKSVVYILEPLSVPYQTIYAETVYNNVLYYVGSNSDINDNLTLVRLNLEEPYLPAFIPLDIPFPISTKELTEPQIMLAINLNGDIYIFAYQYYNDRWAAEVAAACLYLLDENGQLLKTFDISEIVAYDNYGGVNDFTIDSSGNIYILKENKIHVVSSNGEPLLELNIDNLKASLFDYGKEIGILYYSKTDGEYYLSIIDFLNQSLVVKKKLDLNDAMTRSAGYHETDILFFSAIDAVFDYDLTKNQKFKRFAWADLGITSINDNSTRVFSLIEDRVLLTDRYSYDQNPFKIIRPATEEELTAIEANESDELTVITVGLTGPSGFYDFSQLIMSYNKENPDIQVELIEYFDIKTPYPSDWESEFQARYDRATLDLELDIVRGLGPDIVVSRQPLSWYRYSALGIFEDLHSYLSADPNYKWAEYYENITRAYEIDGKLYGLPLFNLQQSLIVRQADTENIIGWNLDEFIAFVDSFDSDETIFANPTKTAILDLCLYANGDVVIDWSSQSPAFNRPFVTKILSFANRFMDDDKYINNTPLDIRAQSGEVKIYAPQNIGELWIPSTIPLFQSIMGEPVRYIGFPSENGSGIINQSDALLSLNAESNNKEAAWHFIKHCYSKLTMSRDEHMEQLESTRGTIVKSSRSDLSISYDITIDDNAIDAFIDLRSSDMQIRIHDLTIHNIIKEEADVYFSGGKSLEDVINIIENRITIYVHETS